MKKLLLFAISSMAAQISFGQYNSAWNYTTLNYNVGIGTKTTNANNNSPTPAFNLHLHGTADYSIIQDFPNPPLNAGKTTRLGFTNTTTGMTSSDGVEFRMTENNFSMENRESGNVRIAVPNVNMTFSNQSSRIWVGTVSNILSTNNARMNVIAPISENGFYIQGPETNGKYGLSVRMIDNASDAIQVNGSLNFMGSLLPIKNFSVKGNGEVNSGNISISSPSSTNAISISTSGNTNVNFKVTNNGELSASKINIKSINDGDLFVIQNQSSLVNFKIKSDGSIFARKYTATINDFPDYVFDENYKLISIEDLKSYISENKHLPNIMSASEYEQVGSVDLVELNKKLVEKIEELTLYIIQLNEKIDKNH